MRVILIDDEIIALDNLSITLDEFSEINQKNCFTCAKDAIDYLHNNFVDIIFLDINMREMNGIEAYGIIKDLQPDCFIIFTTGHSEYAVEAFELKANGYLLKPIKKSAIRKELDYIMTFPQFNKDTNLKIQCFGNFEVFVDGNPLKFRYSKSKELLAYLIDRKGTFCANGEIVSVLWESKTDNPALFSQFRNVLADLISTLKDVSYDNIIIKKRGMVAIDKSKLSCDYYQWLDNSTIYKHKFNGEYMSQYSWAEFTLSGLLNK